MEPSFLEKVKREATVERDRVLKDLERLKFDAQQVIHVLNALNLDVPSELRELSPIERVPVSSTTEVDAIEFVKEEPPPLEVPLKRTGAGARVLKAKAEERFQRRRTEVIAALHKGPLLREELIKVLEFETENTLTRTLARMRKDGEVIQKTRGWQGPSEYSLTECPVSLETLRDEVIKEKGDIPLGEIQTKLGFTKPKYLTRMLNELVDMGIIERNTEEGGYINVRRVAGTQLTTDEREKKSRNGNFGGGQVAGTGKGKISSNKTMRAHIDKAKAQGAKVKTGSNHIMISYKGKTVTVAKTPSESGLLQDYNRMKSIGLNV